MSLNAPAWFCLRRQAWNKCGALASTRNEMIKLFCTVGSAGVEGEGLSAE